MKAHMVIVGVGIGTNAGREILSGVFSFIDRGRAWRPKLVQSVNELNPAALAAMEAGGVDGYLLSFGNEGEPRDFLNRSSKPLVLIGTQRAGFYERAAPTSFVWNDNAAIGAAGARHFASLGTFNSYGFVHVLRHEPYSDARGRGFAAELQRLGRQAPSEYRPIEEIDAAARQAALVEWLKELAKPAAVMVDGDGMALNVLEAAACGGIKIPGQMMVVSVNNDELLVAHSSPPLTSIQPGHYEMGFKAAAELERLMSARRKIAGHTVNVPPQRVVERESTRKAKPAAMLVKRAKEYIRRRSQMGVTAAEVVKFLGCSRELVDLRFREIEGQTLCAAIEGHRLGDVKRLLRTTRRPIATIARQCGFKSASHLSHLFRLRVGVTPCFWRETTSP